MYVKLAMAPNKEQAYHVVGFAMEPKSINYEQKEKHASPSGGHNFDIRSSDQIGEYLSHEEVTEPQELKSGREFKFTYSVDFELVENLTWANRMDNYSDRRKKIVEGPSMMWQWMQLLFMLVAVGLGTYALVRALKLALNKDTIAMRNMPRRPRR